MNEKPEWIPIKDRAPEFPCVLGYHDTKGQWGVCYAAGSGFGGWWTHWHPLAKPPAPAQNEDEKAFEELTKQQSSRTLHDIFMAGVQHGRKGAK